MKTKSKKGPLVTDSKEGGDVVGEREHCETYASSTSSDVTGEASSVLVCPLAMLAFEALLVLLLGKDDSF